MNTAKSHSETDGIKFLTEAFAREREVLYATLKRSSNSITHNGVLGEVNEEHFIELLRRYLPARYSVESGIILDSRGKTSDQIDVVIYDRQYTPILLDQKNHRYILAEAVYAVFEAKPEFNKEYLEYAAEKAESVRKLIRTSAPVPYSYGVKEPKKLFEIIAGIISTDIGWADGFGKAFASHHSLLTDNKFINCGLTASGHCFDTFCDNKTLNVKKGDETLAYFIFRLLKALQKLATAPAVDWDEYANVFSK